MQPGNLRGPGFKPKLLHFKFFFKSYTVSKYLKHGCCLRIWNTEDDYSVMNYCNLCHLKLTFASLNSCIVCSIHSIPLQLSYLWLSSQTRRPYRIKSKAAISLTFNLHCKLIAALFFIPHRCPIWGHCHTFKLHWYAHDLENILISSSLFTCLQAWSKETSGR